MTFTQKRGLLLLLGALLLAVLALAVSLPGMELRQATLYSLMQQGEESGSGFLPGGDSFITIALAFLKGFLAIAVLLFPFYIYLNLQTKKGRRRLFGELVTFLILLLLLTTLKTDRLGELLAQTSQGLQNLASPEALDLPTTEVSFTPPPSLEYYAQGLIWVAVVLMAVVVGLAAWFLARPRFKVPQAAETRQQIAAEAQIAVKELQAGSDFKDTILRCYAQMSQALSEGRGLTRQAAMTPAEFATALKGQGLPEMAVEELTHLFEEVRYGRQRPGPQAEAQALACLNAIIEAVG